MINALLRPEAERPQGGHARIIDLPKIATASAALCSLYNSG
jgi:hypothetical protein